MTTTNMANVEITWQAFGNKPEKNRFVRSASRDFLLMDKSVEQNRLDLCEQIYAATNTYGGIAPSTWACVQVILPEDRTHTALSIGDKIVIDYVHTYIVSECGFVKISGLVD